MADGPAAPVEFGPHQKMTLEAELLQVLTSGDKARMEELLSREDHGAAGSGHQQTSGQVAIHVHGAALGCFLGVTSNGNTALHLVASHGYVELATLLCERVPSLVATRNMCLDTPLHCAAKSGHRDVAAVLLSRMRAGGAEESALRARNHMSATALYEAVRHGRAGVVDLLMTEAPELASIATDDAVSPLYLAATTGSVQLVRALLRPSPNGTPSPAAFSGPEGRNALHAASAQTKEIAEAILSWEPEGPTLLTRVDTSGRTPLHFAVLYGQLDIVELFVDHRASLELASISDNHGSFPLHIAAMVGETRIIDELIKRCPNYYELVDDKGRNLLHCAVERDQERVVRHICQNDMFAVLLNAMDSEGNTPLHLAIKCRFLRIFILLLGTTSVDIGITNKDGLTAGDLAYRAREPDRIYYILDPCLIMSHCMDWLRAPYTLEGCHPILLDHVYKKPAEGEASAEQVNITQNGLIASVLIATVAVAAAFTVPGGFVADDHARAGTAILARRFAFRAFAVSDTMALICSVLATYFLIYGGAREIPGDHRRWYNLQAVRLLPVGSKFMIAAFVFGFQLVLGPANRWFIVFVYVSQASVLFCFPGTWATWRLGLAGAIWRRVGWRGLVNIHEHPSSPLQLLRLFRRSILFVYLWKSLLGLLMSALLVIAIVLSIALPNY